MATTQGVPQQNAADLETQQAASPSPMLDEIVSEGRLTKEHADFDYAIRFAQAAADSQYFQDARLLPQAAMKIMAGKELGLGPVASLMHIHIIKGKVALDGNLIATMLRKAGYTWKPLQHDETGAEFLFYRNGVMMTQLKRDAKGELIEAPLTVSFTRKDADRARLTEMQGDKKDQPSMYDKYPKNMYFNRTITNFQKWHAPEVSNGITVYVPEELTGEMEFGAGAAVPNALRVPQPKTDKPEVAA